MENKANRLVICEKLIEQTNFDNNIIVLTSDSRGSGSLTGFADKHKDNLIEVGIAEQNIVGIASGLSNVGLKPFVASPACFLTSRAFEQIKVDIGYNKSNVKLIGISAGISYGALGMTHYSLQDIAAINAVPNMTIIVPADMYETSKMMDSLKNHNGPVYIRVGRNPVNPIYNDEHFVFEIGKANTLVNGDEITIISFGDLLNNAKEATEILKNENISVRLINMHTLKPIDKEIIIKAAKETKGIITLEEHSVNGGLGSIVCKIISENHPCRVKVMGLPDEDLVSGTQKDLFNHYGLNPENIVLEAKRLLNKCNTF